MTDDIGSYNVLVLDVMRGRVSVLSRKLKIWWPLMAWDTWVSNVVLIRSLLMPLTSKGMKYVLDLNSSFMLAIVLYVGSLGFFSIGRCIKITMVLSMLMREDDTLGG